MDVSSAHESLDEEALGGRSLLGQQDRPYCRSDGKSDGSGLRGRFVLVHYAREKHAAPLRQIEKAAGRFSRLAVKISERYTTKVCSRCHMPTVGVRRDVNGRHVVVQESRYCHSQTCHSAPFKARDYDATLSIGEVFMAMVRGEERPECYTKAGYDARKEELRGQGIDTRDVIIP